MNPAQQKAVDHIYGPLLVLAGPGTGKTQLLSARIANILQKTDARPQNILCLTFTESAAQNMRERLTDIIGADAYDVHINTYHGFGSDIIRDYPEYFNEINLETGEDSRLERPIDELERFQIMSELINALPYSSPLIGARHYVRHVVSTISDLKRSLITPEALEALAEENLKTVRELSPLIARHLSGTKTFPRKPAESIALFTGIDAMLEGKEGLGLLARIELQTALEEANAAQKSTPLTAWKNTWLTKDADDQFRFTDENQHLRMHALATLFRAYQLALKERQLYDFDDMILQVISALNKKDELRYNLQERYQFILLDEFQDTNAAQFELVQRLADNPVNEGKPNIFAVGDDDQAIYAFQGALVSNMIGFVKAFVDVAVINLTENYRSHADIIHVAHNIADQIESRLHYDLRDITKTLTAAAQNLPEDAAIQRHEFKSQASEYAWVASKILELTRSGVEPSDIAVLAPKHTLLENIVPFISANSVPIAYEKRENILETPLLRAYTRMLELILALQEENTQKTNQILPEVVSFDFYDIPAKDIWEINWQTKQLRDKTSDSLEANWAVQALENERLAPHVLFFMTLALKASHEPLEYILDYLTGTTALRIDDELEYSSPLKSHFLRKQDADPLAYYESLANLSTIREHIRSMQQREDKLLSVEDFLSFVKSYEDAEQSLINTHPIAQSKNAVQLMTAYKAKGLEFEHVFLLALHDDIWGKKARQNTNKLSLPKNLQHIRYKGSSEDELRRLLFVAVTRAKHGLYLTSHASKDNGKENEPVKYLLEMKDGDTRKATALPGKNQIVSTHDFTHAETLQHIDTLWHSRHTKLDAELKSLLAQRLERYQMSPTHLNAFIDTEYAGPQQFLLTTLLRFPAAPGEDGEFGNAIHAALDWYQKKLKDNNNPAMQQLLKEYDHQLSRRYLPENRMDDLRARGHHALKLYVPKRADMFLENARSEVDFRKEGVLIGKAHLSGKIDRMEIDTKQKLIRIVDFKTGRPHNKWDRSVKLLKYKQQLYFYKFLIEGSHSWSDYRVASARLEFVEPDAEGNIVEPLLIDFNEPDSKALITEKGTRALIEVVWQRITELDLPDISKYSDDIKGTLAFITDLLGND